MGNPGFGGWTHGAFPAPASALIGQTTLVTSQASVVFDPVPQTFHNLRLVWQARADNNSTTQCIGLRFNSDSGANYDQVTDDSGGAAASASQVGLGFSYIAGSGSTANVAASGVLFLVNYTGTTFFKDAMSYGRINSGPSGSFSNRTEFWSGTWKSTAAVTSIALFTTTAPNPFTTFNNFLAGSYFSLYGEY